MMANKCEISPANLNTFILFNLRFYKRNRKNSLRVQNSFASDRGNCAKCLFSIIFEDRKCLNFLEPLRNENEVMLR